MLCKVAKDTGKYVPLRIVECGFECMEDSRSVLCLDISGKTHAILFVDYRSAYGTIHDSVPLDERFD